MLSTNDLTQNLDFNPDLLVDKRVLMSSDKRKMLLGGSLLSQDGSYAAALTQVDPLTDSAVFTTTFSETDKVASIATSEESSKIAVLSTSQVDG